MPDTTIDDLRRELAERYARRQTIKAGLVGAVLIVSILALGAMAW